VAAIILTGGICVFILSEGIGLNHQWKLIYDVKIWKISVAKFTRKKVLHFLTNWFLNFIMIIGSIASLGSP
jgi:hypothetical protein